MVEVSVVIPIFNNSHGLDVLMGALLSQTYNKELMEIIIVDNRSTDDTLIVARKYEAVFKEQVRVLMEESTQSSYAARNTGILDAQGRIIAMIDSDCIPSPNWIEKGVTALKEHNADLVGGTVRFFIPFNPEPAEMYDAMVSMQMKYTIPNQGSAANANLFVRRDVFNTVGLFPIHEQSGGDIIWTRKAIKSGCIMEYSADTEVVHSTRKLKEFLKKQYRVGTGHPAIWKSENYNLTHILVEILRYFFPPRLESIRVLINQRGTSEMDKYIWSIWLVAWCCRITKNIGRISRILSCNKIRSHLARSPKGFEKGQHR